MNKCYYGSLKNDNELCKSSSGGFAASIAKYAIQRQGVVYGVAYTSDYKGAEFIRATSNEDIQKLRGSKYIHADTTLLKYGGGVFDDIIAGRMVVLIGLPCNISSVMTVLENKGIAHENLVTIDLVCGGDTPASVGEQYIEYLERKFRSNVVEFSVRYKNPNWAPAHLRAVFENGKVFCKEFYSTEYGYAFDHMKREACYCCRFKGENHYSDITIGDGWGVCEKDRGYNAKGVSVAFVHSEAGNRILNELQDIELFEAESNEMERNNPRYLTPKPKLQKDEQFRAAFQKYGLFRACKKAYGYKYRIMRVMPDGVMEYCRRIKHRMEILRK